MQSSRIARTVIETMNTLQTRAVITLTLTVFGALMLGAQRASITDYDFLMSISEPARFDLYDRSIPNEEKNVVPVALPVHAEIDFSHPLPQLAETVASSAKLTITEHLQLATAFRLRGDYVQAVPHYASVLALSNQPIHVFFYAQSLRATGQDLLADLYDARYLEGIGGLLQSQPLSDKDRKGIPVMIRGRVVNHLSGSPIANVEVRLVNICTEEELITTTDKAGNYQFKDHPADCAFVVRFEKRFFDVVLVEAPAPHKDDRVDIELDQVKDLSFR